MHDHFESPKAETFEDVRQQKILEEILPTDYFTRELGSIIGAIPKDVDRITSLVEQMESIAATFQISHFLDAIPNGHALLKEDLKRTLSSNDPQLAERVARSFFSFITSRLPLGRLEAVERAYYSTREGYINELLHYDIHDTELTLHVAASSTLPLKTKIRLLRDGLRILAREFTENAELRPIQTIRNRSWIIREHPELLRKLGFRVGVFDMSDEDMVYNEDVAVMSKEDFIARYAGHSADLKE